LKEVRFVGCFEAVAVVIAGEYGVEKIALIIAQSGGGGEAGTRADDNGFRFFEGGFDEGYLIR
jgi:hypothetical protein